MQEWEVISKCTRVQKLKRLPLPLSSPFVEGVSSNLSSLSVRRSIAEERSFTSASGKEGFAPLVAAMFVSCVSSVHKILSSSSGLKPSETGSSILIRVSVADMVPLILKRR